VLGKVAFYFIAAGQPAFDLLLDRQARLLAVECQNLVDGVKKLFRLPRCDLDLWLFRSGSCGDAACGGEDSYPFGVDLDFDFDFDFGFDFGFALPAPAEPALVPGPRR